MMTVDPTTLAAIVGMASATVLTRLAGFWLVQKITIEGRLAAALEAVPGAILISLIAPIVFAKGPAEGFAGLVTVLIAKRAPALVAVAGGVATVALLRAVLPQNLSL